MNRKTVFFLGLMAAILMVATSAFSAPIPAIGGFNSATTTTDTTSFSNGWDFTTDTPITVNSLGYLDAGANGLTGSHEVGVYDSSGQPLRTAIVPSGTAGILDGCFRYVDLTTPITLQPGEIYTIAAVSNGGSGADAYVADRPAAFTTGQGITVIANRTSPSTTVLTYPTVSNTDADQGFFGPNFTFEAPSQNGRAAIPEPSVAVLLLMGIFGSALYRRKSG